MLKKANTADFYRSLDMTKMYSIFFFKDYHSEFQEILMVVIECIFYK